MSVLHTMLLEGQQMTTQEYLEWGDPRYYNEKISNFVQFSNKSYLFSLRVKTLKWTHSDESHQLFKRDSWIKLTYGMLESKTNYEEYLS